MGTQLVALTSSHPVQVCFGMLHSKGTRQGKLHNITGDEGPEREQRYNSTLSLTSALDGVGA